MIATLEAPGHPTKHRPLGPGPGADVVVNRAALAEDVRRLSRISNIRAALALGMQWSVIAASIGAAVLNGHWAAYLLASAIVATRQHALAVLMHEASHYRLFENRWFNDLASDVFAAFPLGLCTSLYRRTHLMHHAHTSTAGDPDWEQMREMEDWQWPKMQWQCLCVFLRDLTGLNTFAQMRILRQWSPLARFFDKGAKRSPLLSLRERITFIAFFSAVPSLLWITNSWMLFFWFWLLPMSTGLIAIFRLRGIAEHAGVDGDHELNKTRTVYPSRIERAILAPLNVNYHIEHHLFPSVPWYNLGDLHDLLMDQKEYRDQAHLTYTYTGLRRGVLAELIEPTGDPMHENKVAPTQ